MMCDTIPGALSAPVVSLHPRLAYVPRLAAMEVWETRAGAHSRSSSSGVSHGYRRALGGDTTLLLHFSTPPDESGELDLGFLWEPAMSTAAVPRIVVNAIPHALVPATRRALEARGRAVTFEEPCRTWEPAAGSIASWTAPASAMHDAAAAALPAGFVLGPLEAGDAELVDACWKYRVTDGASLALVSECIRERPSACARPVGGGPPVCWGVMRTDGSWGLLHTQPAARRLGLATAVMLYGFAAQRAWADKEIKRGGTRGALAALSSPFVHIATNNAVSEAFFTKLGLIPVADVTWVISAKLLGDAPPTPAPIQWTPLRALGIITSPSLAAALLAHINASYKQDDAFFVEQERTTLDSLLAMAREGTFFASFSVTDSGEECPELLVCVYLKVIPPLTGEAEVDALPPASPFAADARQNEGCSIDNVAPTSQSGTAPMTLAPPYEHGPTASLSMLTIAPRLKRQGCAARVLERILAIAKEEHGCAAAEVFIVSVKPWLLRFYVERFGFEVVGAEPWPAFLEHQLRLDCFFHQCRKLL